MHLAVEAALDRPSRHFQHQAQARTLRAAPVDPPAPTPGLARASPLPSPPLPPVGDARFFAHTCLGYCTAQRRRRCIAHGIVPVLCERPLFAVCVVRCPMSTLPRAVQVIHRYPPLPSGRSSRCVSALLLCASVCSASPSPTARRLRCCPSRHPRRRCPCGARARRPHHVGCGQRCVGAAAACDCGVTVYHASPFALLVVL